MRGLLGLPQRRKHRPLRQKELYGKGEISMKKRVVSILASIALFASAFFVFPAVSPVLAGGAGSPLTQEHPQAIHVWYERILG